MCDIKASHFEWKNALLALLFLIACCASEPAQSSLPQQQHGLYFETPAEVWDEALPLGNGIMGALIWGDGTPVKISLDRADLWDLRQVPEFYSEEYSFQLMRQWHEEGRVEDLIRVYEEPYNRPAPTKIPAGRIEIFLEDSQGFLDTGLNIADAVASLSMTNGTTAQFLVHAEEPLGLIKINSANAVIPRLIAPPFAGKVKEEAAGGIGAGDLAQLGYSAPEETFGDNWTAFQQEGAEGFRFAAYLSWRSQANEWQAAWSVASSFEDEEPFRLARDRVNRALEAGYEAALTSHRRWWHSYWAQSSVNLPNPIIQKQYLLDMYKFGAASRRGAPPVTLQAVWTADNGQLPPWKGDYHHDLNTQLSYWPCYTGNQLENGLAYLDWLWETREAGFDWTRRFFGLPGLNVPMTADLNGNQIGGWRQYTHSATTAAWLAHHFYLHWRYSGDRDFLQTRAYPYLRDAALFLEAFTSKKDGDGLRTFPLSASPEINDNRPEAWFATVTNYDLALTKWLFAATAELARELNLQEEFQRWSAVLEELPELRLGEAGTLLVAEDYPLQESHRHFSHLMAIHPLGLLDWTDGEEARRTILASLKELEKLGSDWWTGYSFSWLANLAARARNGEKAEKALETFATAFTLRSSFHCNGDQTGEGYSKYTYRPFTLEGNFAAAAGIQEMLLQSHTGTLLLFPAIPDSWSDVSFKKLRSQGAFLVSAEMINHVVTQVEITSEKGGLCSLVSPFTGEKVQFQMGPGDTVSLDASKPAGN